MIITDKDIVKHKLSSGLLFYYNNELHVAFDMFAPIEFFKNMPVQKLEPTDMYYDGRPVFKVKEYIHRVRIQELPISLVKKIINTICDINEKCGTQYKHYLNDVHEGNVALTTDGVTWFDMDSFSPEKVAEINSIALTCYLIQKYLYKNYKHEHSNYNINVLKNTDCYLKSFLFKDNILSYNKDMIWSHLKHVVSLFDESVPETYWSDNYSNIMDIDNPEKVNPKAKIVADIIDSLSFDTVTDVGCNKGYFSFYSSKKAKSVIGIDYDVTCIQKAINFGTENNYNNVLFAIKDVKDLCNNLLCEDFRFKSDLVLGLAIVHHISGIVSIKQFSESLARLSNKYILLEDIDAKDLYEKEFIELGFKLVKRVNSYPESRTLSLYERG